MEKKKKIKIIDHVVYKFNKTYSFLILARITYLIYRLIRIVNKYECVILTQL